VSRQQQKKIALLSYRTDAGTITKGGKKRESNSPALEDKAILLGMTPDKKDVSETEQGRVPEKRFITIEA